MQLQAKYIPLGKTETVKQNRTNCGGSESKNTKTYNHERPRYLSLSSERSITYTSPPPPNLLMIHFNIIFKSTPKTSNWSHSSIFSHQNSKHLSKEIRIINLKCHPLRFYNVTEQQRIQSVSLNEYQEPSR